MLLNKKVIFSYFKIGFRFEFKYFSKMDICQFYNLNCFKNFIFNKQKVKYFKDYFIF